MRHVIYALLSLFLFIQVFSEEVSDLPYSAPDQIVALTQESGKIRKIINPLSGQPCLRQTDLIAKGAQDVVLRRTFISQHRDWYANLSLAMSKSLIQQPQKVESGWVIFPHIRLDHVTIAKRKHHRTQIVKDEMRVVDQNGVALTFALRRNGKTQLVDKPYGICNFYEDMPSGQYDLRNTKVVNKGNIVEVYSPHGSIYQYGHQHSNIYTENHTKTKKSAFLLLREILPNGKVLRYRYNQKKELIHVESLDPKERYVYASIDINSAPSQTTSKFLTNSGKMASYQHKIKNNLMQPRDTRALNLLSINAVSNPLCSFETLSLDRALLHRCVGRRNFACQYAESGELLSKNKRVSKLLLPGEDAQFYAIHEFNYKPPLIGEKPGKTYVKNIDGSCVVYEYSSQLLLTAIKHFDAYSVLKKKKKFYWTPNHWLSSLAVSDGNGYLLYKKEYQYDRYGNPVLEVFCGDIIGKGVYENISIARNFSKDGRHLLLEEKHDDGKTLSFQYLPNTDLILTKLTQENDRILLRECYEYDDCHNLIKAIKDNGTTSDPNNLSGVTHRTVTNYILRSQPPFLHLPEWIEEKYLENGSEKFLKRTHLIYDTHGNICEETVYDANSVFAYTLHKSYNDQGNIILESNAIGQQAVYDYDDKGRRIVSTNFSKTVLTKMKYDQRDRLIKIEETGMDHIVHTTAYTYDLNDNLIRKVDPFQNVTEYIYDPLCHKVIRTNSPEIQGQDEKSIPVITASTYDPFGRELSKTDANGNVTTFHYAGHVLPVEIVYANGSKESFSYTKAGLLENHIDREGLKTFYCYDVLGRMVSKSFSTSSGEIAKETFIYDSFNLIEKINLEGVKTSYSYDGAGRLVTEETAGTIVHYVYDALGRISIIINENGKNSLYTHYKRDLLDRVLEKQCTDASGQILSEIKYHYDADGNVSAIIRNINGKEARETFTYDSFQRPIEAIDAVGNGTKTIYNESAINALGQRVIQVTTVNAKNISTIQIEDAYGRIVQEDVVGPNNKLITSQKMTYDPNGNLLQKKNLIFQHGQHQRTLETQYNYTSCNSISSLIRAANSSNSRTALYTYTPSGKIASKTKPDGTVISYTYDPLGCLKTMSSSDHKLKLTYYYNPLGRLIQATDELTNVSIQRTVDPHGNILSEKLSTGLTIQKTYDALNRPLSVDLPNQGRILYTYDSLFLRSISRLSSSGELLYTHHYTSYDTSGYLQEENLIGSLGTVKHTFDAKGRQTSITSSYLQESYTYDETNNIDVITTNDHTVNCSYDELNQLTNENKEAYLYDTNYNQIQKNNETWTFNELDELLAAGEAQCTYDLNGNLLSKKTPTETVYFTYDLLDRLIQVSTTHNRIEMAYDPLGRRLSKTVYKNSSQTTEHYLYDGDNDICAFTPEGKPLQLRTLGLRQNRLATVAIELKEQAFASIQDVQGNTRCLICPSTGEKMAEYHFNAFGRPKWIQENTFNPWRYATKRLDPEINLINFGKRYYDIELSRWTTTDPAGFIDSMNLYAYVKNNPYRYIDFKGQFAIPLIFIPALEIAFDSVVSWISAKALIGAVVGAVAGIGVYQLDKALDNDDQDIAINNEAVIEDVESAKEKKGKRKGKDNETKGGPPRDPQGNYLPDPAAENNPHTNLGTRNGSEGPYIQGTTFDQNGKFKGRTDATNHGRHDHFSPHYHPATGSNSVKSGPHAIPESL